jgi:GTP cyclohydrolase I
MDEKRFAEAIKLILNWIPDDPLREGLRETPDRVARAFKEMTAGYQQDIKALFKTFPSDYKRMVILSGCEFYSLCECHLLPFFGVAHVGYIPNDEVIGISKLARLVDAYAKRLQTQERLTEQIVDAIEQHLRPKGSICVIEATHLCIRLTGETKKIPKKITSAKRGIFKDDKNEREEFFRLVKNNI